MARKIYILFALAILCPSLSLAMTFTKDLSLGMTNDAEVSALQTFLTSEGLYSGPVTGNYFARTLGSVKLFQDREGIKPTGYFGPLTRTRANEIANPGTPPATISFTDPRQEYIKSLIAQIQALQKMLADLNAQTPSPLPTQPTPTVPVTNPTVPMNPTQPAQPTQPTQPVAPGAGPVVPAKPEVVLVPKLELIDAPAQIKAGNISTIIAEIKLSNFDEDMQFGQLPVTITSSIADFKPEYDVYYKSMPVPVTNNVFIKKDFVALVYVYIKKVPADEGTITVSIKDWTLYGVTSGDIRKLEGDALRVIDVVK